MNLPEIVVEQSLNQQLALEQYKRELEDANVSEDIKEMVLSLVRQNMLLRNNITNLVKAAAKAQTSNLF